MANIKISRLFLCFVLITFGAVPSLAVIYTVGDSSGWALGVDYTSWGAEKTFKVGDNLVFNYDKKRHTVDEVSVSDYSACGSGKPISSDNNGSTTVTLKTSENHYFISGVTGDCDSGMRLVVRVVAASTRTALF